MRLSHLFIAASFLQLASSYASAECRVEYAESHLFSPVSNESFEASKRRLCYVPAYNFKSDLERLLPSKTPDNGHLNDAAFRLRDMIEIANADWPSGLPLERVANGELIQLYSEEISRRASTFKYDKLRSAYYRRKNVYAPGECRVFKFSALWYCDENYTTTALQPIVELAISLAERNVNEAFRTLIISRVEAVTDYYLDNQMREFDRRYPKTLLYVGESYYSKRVRPMHTNGLSEFGRLMLLLKKYFRTIGSRADADRYHILAVDLRDFVTSTFDEFQVGSRLFCRWRYFADEPSPEDPRHGVALVSFLMELHDEGMAPVQTPAIVTGWLSHGFSGSISDNNLAFKDEFKVGTYKDNGTVLDSCGWSIYSFRANKEHHNYCAKSGLICR